MYLFCIFLSIPMQIRDNHINISNNNLQHDNE